ncbi:MFS transporter [Pararobbsia silviterrae]|uniref:MFS transporter n=1 Tax=Pararobbsia silviterrae TaxID=1792498 RepID=A0A494XS33_9BURK|nr:MFS transporter [Pararobbsia silviterrae]RKP53415.1 MFS transporter [Pararobbsia silviterrae]
MNTSTASSHAGFTPALARIVATVSVGFVVTQLDVTIVNIALARIAIDLGAAVSGLQWIVDAYTLAFAALMLSAGVLGDRFGARRMFTSGIALFLLASLGCAIATRPAVLIAARALQGVAAAAMLPNSLALLNRACGHDPKLRARAVGLWTAAGSVSIAAGPVVGGILIAAFGWRSIFFVNVPICLAGVLASLAWAPRDEADTARVRVGTPAGTPHGGDKAATSGARQNAGARVAPNARSVDLPGQALAIVALTAFTGAAIECRPRGLADPIVWGAFAVAFIAAIAFIAVESRARSPMLPLALFGNRTFSAAVLFGICVNLSYYGMVFVLSLFLQRVRGDTPLAAGLAFLPLTGGFLISNLLSGHVVAHYGSRVPMVGGALMAALGYAALMRLDAATSQAGMLIAFLLIPLGMGMAVPAMTTAILASVDKPRAGTASAVLNTARQAGGAVGVAAFGALASGISPAHIVEGMHAAASLSVALLLAGAALGCIVRAHPHEHAHDAVRSRT